MRKSVNKLCLVSLAAVMIALLSFSCGGKKSGPAAKSPQVPPTPPIYQDISDFEKPPCATPEVKIKQGQLCGSVISTAAGKEVNAYLGIPFAESTGGQNRWKPPGSKD